MYRLFKSAMIIFSLLFLGFLAFAPTKIEAGPIDTVIAAHHGGGGYHRGGGRHGWGGGRFGGAWGGGWGDWGDWGDDGYGYYAPYYDDGYSPGYYAPYSNDEYDNYSNPYHYFYNDSSQYNIRSTEIHYRHK